MARAESADGVSKELTSCDTTGGGQASTPAPASVEHCSGCRNAYRHKLPNGCWSFKTAVLLRRFRARVPKGWRGDLRELPRDGFQPVQVPFCYIAPGVTHVDAIPKECK